MRKNRDFVPAVFVLGGAEKRYDAVNEVPEVLLSRLISIRAFDLNHWMVEGDVCDGQLLDALIHKLLAKPEVAYLREGSSSLR